MVGASVFCAFVGLLQATASLSISPRADPNDDIPLPKLLSDFKKGDVPAKWAQGYPKKWGSEEFNLHFNVPVPEDMFNGIITDDEKYVVMFNGTHVTFVDLDTKTAMSTFSLEIPPGAVSSNFRLRATPQGGYDVLTSVGESKYANPFAILRKRIASDLKPTGGLISYKDVGDIGDIRNGKLATTGGHIVDLDSSNSTNVMLKNPPDITSMSFSGDGQYLSTVGWQDRSADLWNATSGEKILQFSPTKMQNWATKVSPDGKYVVVSLGSGNGPLRNALQIYAIANLTAPPIILSSFNSDIRSIDFSPDSKQLVACDNGRLRLWSIPEAEILQTWEIDLDPYDRFPAAAPVWLDDGKKLSFTYDYAKYIYDLDSNVKWIFTEGYDDHSWGSGSVYYLKKKGWVATADGDSQMRFWKI
jgi:hypothetical protein